MAKINFGGVLEEVVTREEFPLEKAREVDQILTCQLIDWKLANGLHPEPGLRRTRRRVDAATR